MRRTQPSLVESKIIIAIDGHSSCGKSTLAKALAKALHYIYVDSGAMYRAVTLYFIEQGVDWQDAGQVDAALADIDISFKRSEAGVRTCLNGRDIEDAIRSMEVSSLVSPVSTLSAVRRALVRQQQALGTQRGVVMDGRDIGTVVFPDAELKLFVTADIEERTRRRFEELKAKGQNPNWDEVQHNLAERDRIDASREDSPLRQADDAVVLDNTHLTESEQLAVALEMAQARL